MCGNCLRIGKLFVADSVVDALSIQKVIPRPVVVQGKIIDIEVREI